MLKLNQGTLSFSRFKLLSALVRLQFVHSSVKSDFGGARRQSKQRVKGDDVVCYFEFN